MNCFSRSPAAGGDHTRIFAEFSMHLMGLLLARRAATGRAGPGNRTRPPRFRVVR